jgi:hypothetical protein
MYSPSPVPKSGGILTIWLNTLSLYSQGSFTFFCYFVV